MDRYEIYKVDRKGSNIARRISDKTFLSFQEAKGYAMRLAENIAAELGEKVEMIEPDLRSVDKSVYGRFFPIAKMYSYFICVRN